MLYFQLQAVNIAYVIIHRMEKLNLAVREWNCMTIVQKMWVVFKKKWKSHQDLRETSDITIENAGVHHANMVRDVVAGVQEVL